MLDISFLFSIFLSSWKSVGRILKQFEMILFQYLSIKRFTMDNVLTEALAGYIMGFGDIILKQTSSQKMSFCMIW